MDLVKHMTNSVTYSVSPGTPMFEAISRSELIAV